MGPIFLCLVSLLIGKPSRPDVVVFGDLNANGYFLSSWKCTVKMVEHAMGFGIRKLVMAEDTEIEAEARKIAEVPHAVDGKAKIALVTVDCLKELLCLTAFDVYRTCKLQLINRAFILAWLSIPYFISPSIHQR